MAVTKTFIAPTIPLIITVVILAATALSLYTAHAAAAANIAVVKPFISFSLLVIIFNKPANVPITVCIAGAKALNACSSPLSKLPRILKADTKVLFIISHKILRLAINTFISCCSAGGISFSNTPPRPFSS